MRKRIWKPEGPERVATYTRVSSDEQVREHFSLEFQWDKCVANLNQSIGEDLYVTQLFSDEGVPGRYGLYDPANPRRKYRLGLTAMRDAFKAGQFDTICVYRSDRLWRRAALGDLLRYEFIPYGLQRIISCYEHLDLSTASGRFQMDIAAAVGAYQVEQLGENVADGLRKRKEHGYSMGRPYGWRTQTELEQTGRKPGLTPVPEQADIVSELAERYVGGTAIRALTKWLNTLAVPTPRGGFIWHHGTVKHILTNPVNAGLLETEDEDGRVNYVEGEHYSRRIYDPEVFYQIRARVERNRERGAPGSATPQYLLGGIVRCGHCGHRLNGRLIEKRQVRVYRCSTGSLRSNPECTRNQERVDVVEGFVLGELKKLASDEAVRAAARQQVGALLAEEQSKVAHEIEALRARLDRLWNDYRYWCGEHRAGNCREDEFAVHLADFRSSKAEVEARLGELEAQQVREEQGRVVLSRALELVGDFAGSWDGLSVTQRREFMQSVVADATMARLADGQTEVTCTIHGYPAVTRHFGRRAVANRPATGVESLTRRQQALLYHRSQGLEPAAIAQQLGVSKRQVSSQLSIVRRKLGAGTLDEAWLLAKEYVEAHLHWLPLTGRIRKRSAARPGRPILTASQSGLLAALRGGAAPKQAAAELGISENTAYVQLRNCRERLGVGSNEEAVRKAVELGFVT